MKFDNAYIKSVYDKVTCEWDKPATTDREFSFCKMSIAGITVLIIASNEEKEYPELEVSITANTTKSVVKISHLDPMQLRYKEFVNNISQAYTQAQIELSSDDKSIGRGMIVAIKNHINDKWKKAVMVNQTRTNLISCIGDFNIDVKINPDNLVDPIMEIFDISKLKVTLKITDVNPLSYPKLEDFVAKINFLQRSARNSSGENVTDPVDSYETFVPKEPNRRTYKIIIYGMLNPNFITCSFDSIEEAEEAIVVMEDDSFFRLQRLYKLPE